MDRDTPQTLQVRRAAFAAVVATADNSQHIVCEFTPALGRVALARRMVAAYNATQHIPVEMLETCPQLHPGRLTPALLAVHEFDTLLEKIKENYRAVAAGKNQADLIAAADKLQARGFFTQTTCADADTNTDMQIFSDTLARCKGDAQ